MCGIAGFVSRTGAPDIAAALGALRHRGPDAQQHWSSRVGDYTIGLGHARLSILDLSEAANQPFASGDDRFMIVYNGEIYNHNELRAELRALGAAFRTRSDTEVVVEAYRSWGARCVERFDGMFAFAIVDQVQRQVFFARDQFGIKPLYYCRDRESDALYFASEIRALSGLSGIRLAPDPSRFAEFLLNGWLYDPDTGILNVHKLGIGERALLDLRSGEWTAETYFSHSLQLGGGGGGGDDVEAGLREAMAGQIEADVPVGLFFSGGIDSTALAVSSPRQLQAIFVGHADGTPEYTRESAEARAIAEALGLPLRVIHADDASTPEDILNSFRVVARGTEEPISDFTFDATLRVAQLARSLGYKVMLSGMGGDELFAGYPRYAIARHWRAMRAARWPVALSMPLLRAVPRHAKRADRLLHFLRAPDFAEAYTALLGYFAASETAGLLGTAEGVASSLRRVRARLVPVAGASLLKQAMYLDRFGFLAHNLTVTDKASMAHGCEVRVPLITERLGAAGLGAPDDVLLRGRVGKLPLRRIIQAHLPEGFQQGPKVGFNPPLDAKIRTLGQGRLADLLTTGPVSTVLDQRLVGDALRRHFREGRNETYRLWQLTYFALWLESLSS